MFSQRLKVQFSDEGELDRGMLAWPISSLLYIDIMFKKGNKPNKKEIKIKKIKQTFKKNKK